MDFDQLLRNCESEIEMRLLALYIRNSVLMLKRRYRCNSFQEEGSSQGTCGYRTGEFCHRFRDSERYGGSSSHHPESKLMRRKKRSVWMPIAGVLIAAVVAMTLIEHFFPVLF